VFLEDIAPTKVLESQHFLYKFTTHRHYVLTVEKSFFFAGVRGTNEASPAAARCFFLTIVFLVIPPPGTSSK
jgi:hypothetical protein